MMEAELRIELRYSDLQSGTLPLCYSAFIVGKTTVQKKIGAGNEARTRDPDLGKVVLYH